MQQAGTASVNLGRGWAAVSWRRWIILRRYGSARSSMPKAERPLNPNCIKLNIHLLVFVFSRKIEFIKLNIQLLDLCFEFEHFLVE